MDMKKVIDAIFKNWVAKVLSFVSALFLYSVYVYSNFKEETLNVKIEYFFSDKLVPLHKPPPTVQVKVKIAKDKTGLLEKGILEANISFSDCQGKGICTRELQIRKRPGVEDDIEVKNKNDKITLYLDEKESKILKVVPVFKGEPKFGYKLEDYSVKPSKIKITGPKETLANLNQLNLEEVSLDGKEDTFFRDVAINNTVDGVVLENNFAELTVNLTYSSVTKVFSNVEVVFPVIDGLYFDNPNFRGRITVKGDKNLVNALSEGDFKIKADTSNLSAINSEKEFKIFFYVENPLSRLEIVEYYPIYMIAKINPKMQSFNMENKE